MAGAPCHGNNQRTRDTDSQAMKTDSLKWKPVTKECGVYQLRLGGVIVYIGRAKNVARRVAEHRWERRMEFDEALFAEVPESDLLTVERALIGHHVPAFNVNCVGWELRGDRIFPNSPKNAMTAAEHNTDDTTLAAKDACGAKDGNGAPKGAPFAVN
jgi:hypothetical protein